MTVPFRKNFFPPNERIFSQNIPLWVLKTALKLQLNPSGRQAAPSKWRAYSDDAEDRGHLLAVDRDCNLQQLAAKLWWHFMGHLAWGLSTTTAMPLKYLVVRSHRCRCWWGCWWWWWWWRNPPPNPKSRQHFISWPPAQWQILRIRTVDKEYGKGIAFIAIAVKYSKSFAVV